MHSKADAKGPIRLESHDEGSQLTSVVLSVRVVPGASKSEIVGIEGDALKVRVAAPPVRGKANKELTKTLARALGIASRDVEVVAGHTARLKKVRVHGADPAAVSRLLAGPGDGPG